MPGTPTALPGQGVSPSYRPYPPTTDSGVPGRKSAVEMTPEEALDAVLEGRITVTEYCSRDTFLSSGDTQMCFYYNNPDAYVQPSTPPASTPSEDSAGSWRDSPTRTRYSYDEAYTAWQEGEPYYEAFCLNYVPVTPEGESQCDGIEAGTVDSYTGAYIGP